MPVNKVVLGNQTLIDISDTEAIASDVSVGKFFYSANGLKTAGTLVGADLPVADSAYVDDDTLVIEGGDGGETWETEFDSTATIVSSNPNYIAINNYSDPINANETYRVTYDGDTYVFETQYSSTLDGYYFGNPGVVNPSEDDGSGATFLFYKRTATQLVGAVSDSPGQVAIMIEKKVSGSSTISLQSKTVTPTTSQQTITADSGYDGLDTVTVAPIPSQYIDTSDADATDGDILIGKTAYVNGTKITGGVTALQANNVYYDSTVRRVIIPSERMTSTDIGVRISDLGLIPEDEGGSSWTKLAETNVTVSTTSTNASSTGTINTNGKAWDGSKIIYVRIRDTQGRRAGYFYGSDNFFINLNAGTGSASTFTDAIRIIHRYSTSSQMQIRTSAGTTAYGVYAYSISNNGIIVLYKRYNSTNSLTINSTYSVEVYSIDYPDGVSPFDI